MRRESRRIYVEKNPPFDGAARALREELAVNLGLSDLAEVRILQGYDLEGLDGHQIRRAVDTVLSEPNVDRVRDQAVFGPPWQAFAVEYLPGQYDQRADSAAQCIQIVTGGPPPKVASFQVIALRPVTPEDLERVKAYLINPVDSREKSLAGGARLAEEAPAPPPVPVLRGVRGMDPEDLEALHGELGLSMSREDFRLCQEYFVRVGRDPTLTEIRVIDTYWSDHCRHTTFHTRLESVEFPEGPGGARIRDTWEQYLSERAALYGEELPAISLMDLAVIRMKSLRRLGGLGDLDLSGEINACSLRVPVRTDGGFVDALVMFKNETHNHPTEIEPFGGAATCLGGAIRDPLSGRAFVYQAMRVTGSGDPREPIGNTWPGKLPQRRICREAARGYSSYGNQVGLATGLVRELYHSDYRAKRMEIGAVVGAAPASQVVRQTPEPDDVVVLVGGRTGRDGCGGATGSSREHDEESILRCGAEVQKGNPPTERNLQRLFSRADCAPLIRRCNDFGAGGASVAIGELAGGVEIDLDAIPRKYEGLDGTELAISESQERMAVVLAPGDRERFLSVCREENLEATVVATVTRAQKLRMRWRGEWIVDLDRSFLDTNGAPRTARARIPSPGEPPFFGEPAGDGPWTDRWLERLGSLDAGSQEGLGEIFDSTIGSGTILMPYGGRTQSTPAQGMAACIPIGGDPSHTATVMTFGFHPGLSGWCPYHGAMHAVAESVSRAVCLGAGRKEIRFSFQEYFGKPGTDPASWGAPLSALLGAYAAQQGLGLAAIGGKDSMSGTYRDHHVPPTLVSFALAPVPAGEVRGAELSAPGSEIWYLPCPRHPNSAAIDFAAYQTLLDAVHQGIRGGTITAAAAAGPAGPAVTLCGMALGNRLGVSLRVDPGTLLAPDPAGILLETRAAPQAPGARRLGVVMERPAIAAPGGELDLETVHRTLRGVLEGVYPTGAPEPDDPVGTLHAEVRRPGPAKSGGGAPRILIPVFPGTNCEEDSRRAFARAGGLPETLVFCNQTPGQTRESLAVLEAKIRRSQILMIPGGFSAGDEPDGSGKFIAAVLRDPGVADAVMDLLHHRHGLILGICNGFQALIKTGLLPWGFIKDQEPTDPALIANLAGRHVSRFVQVRVSSVLSPWMARTEAGALYQIPVSHGEGRFVASDPIRDLLVEHGQIATQYVDPQGQATNRFPWNPNGSLMALEALSSRDGRILGRMGHPERSGPYMARNIPGPRDDGMFAAGVDYFRR